MGGIFTRFFELLKKFLNRKCLGLWAQNMCHVVKLTFSDLVEIPNFEHFEFCPKFWRKMLNNANEWYSYYLKGFVVIFEPKEATLNIIKKKNLLIKFDEIFDSQKMTKKTKSSFLGSILTSFFELLEKVYDRKCLGLWAQKVSELLNWPFLTWWKSHIWTSWIVLKFALKC